MTEPIILKLQILSNTLACKNIYWYWGYETENWVRRCRSTKDFGSNSWAVLRESVLGYNKNIWNPMQSAILDAICRLLMTVGKRDNEQLSHENLIVLLDYFVRFCHCLWRKIMGALRSVCNLQGFLLFFFPLWNTKCFSMKKILVHYFWNTIIFTKVSFQLGAFQVLQNCIIFETYFLWPEVT